MSEKVQTCINRYIPTTIHRCTNKYGTYMMVPRSPVDKLLSRRALATDLLTDLATACDTLSDSHVGLAGVVAQVVGLAPPKAVQRAQAVPRVQARSAWLTQKMSQAVARSVARDGRKARSLATEQAGLYNTSGY